MKLLNGSELVDFIKVRQAKQIRTLRQADKVFPKLAILQTIDDPVIDTYVRMKRRYGDDILVDVDVRKVAQADLLAAISQLNSDESIHGIIVQLPLAIPAETQAAIDAVDPSKDVDGLGANATLDPATPTAINWLLAGYAVDLKAKTIAIVGMGRLVGAPLAKMWTNSGYIVTTFDEDNGDLSTLVDYDIIVTATGVAGLITPAMVKHGAVVVDAGTASEHGKIVGDVSSDVRERDDISITPVRGGVGPLTVAALFDNVITAATKVAELRKTSQ